METVQSTQESSAFASCFFLTGATASGKTALGAAAARELGAEVVSLDSMAIYRGMDVGVAKPTLKERLGVPHHMIDVADPREEYSLADYLRESEAVVRDVERRGGKALFVGGTPLYLKAILFGVFESPAADPALREKLRRMEERDAGALWRELERVDPRAAAKIHPNDVKRLTRALEVFRLSGKPISEQQTQFDAAPRTDPRRVFILTWSREELYRRINLRVRRMIDEGFLDEARRLEESGIRLGATASMAVGYREMRAVLKGERSLDEAIERVSQNTRNFAKRQETWFRSLEKIGARRLDANGKTFEELLSEFVDAIRAFG